MLEAGAKLHRGFLANLLPPRFPSVTPLGGFILRGSYGLIGGGLGRVPAADRQLEPSVCGRGRGEREVGRPPPWAGQLLPCLQKRSPRALLPLGHLGPQPSVWKLHTWGRRAWRAGGGPPAVRGPSLLPSCFVGESRVRDTLGGAATGGHGHPSAPPGSGPAAKVFARGLGPAEICSQWARPGLGRSGDHCSRNNAPWKFAQPGKVGGWGSPEEALPA